MTFKDNPKVDLNAERSEESILRCKSFFSKKNGFISHSVDGSNDYGTDINCQIIDQSHVTPFQFPIQVKSKIQFREKRVNNEVSIVTQFETSRLSYLIKHTPTTGIIVLFDENRSQLYYDFVFEIFNRIRIYNEDNLWQNQKTITISIPKANVLNSENIINIHDRCLRYYKNHDKLLSEHGKDYGLPTIEDISSGVKKLPLEILEEIGELMFYYNKYPELQTLLEQLDMRSLKRQQIAYIAAITYAEIGNIIEADYFLQICEKNTGSLTQKQRDTLKFQKFKFYFYSGKASRKDLRLMLENIGDSLTDPDDIIYFKINLLNLDLLDSIGDEAFDETIIQESEAIFKEIEKSNINELSKNFQFISVADILGKAVNSKLTTSLIDSRIIEATGGNKRTRTREILTNRIISLNDKCYLYLQNALNYARNENNELLLAHSYLSLATLFFGKCLAFFMAKEVFENKNYSKSLLKEIYRNSLFAFNIFNKLGLKTFAYTSITLSSEINRLAKYWEDINLNNIADLSEIKKTIESFKSDDFNKRFESVVEKVNQRHKDLDLEFPMETQKALFTESQIESLAKSFIRNNGLPENRLVNIKKEIEVDQVFRLRCRNPDFVLTSEQKSFGEDAYILNDPKYAVFTKSNNLLIVEGYDINIILQKLGF